MKLRMKSFGSKRLPIWGQVPFRTRVVVLGVLLTAGVLGMEGTGALVPLENWLYDARALRCQRFAPAPTTQLVHLDIDDAAIQATGKWPWSRRLMAALVDEIREAKASSLALDVEFSDRDKRDDDVARGMAAAKGSPATGPTTAPTSAADDEDAALAAAVERFGRVVLAAGFEFGTARESELRRVVREQLRGNLELTPEQLSEWLKRYGGRALRGTDADVVREMLVTVRRDVALEKLIAAPRQPVEELLPTETRGGLIRTSPLLRLVEDERRRARAIITMGRLFPREVPADVPDLLVAKGELPPLEELTQAIFRANAAGARGLIGSATSATEVLSSDGVVRSVPLLINDRGHLLPQFGLALACLELGVDPTSREELSVTADQVVLSPPGGEPIVIPVSTLRRGGNYPPVGANFPVPWFGGKDWRTMYDWPKRRAVANHFPITYATAIVERRGYIRNNRENLADALTELRSAADLPPADLKKAVAELVDETLKGAEFQVEEARSLSAADLDALKPAERAKVQKIRAAADALPLLKTQTLALQAELDQAIERLRRAVEGKAVIVGSTASMAADVVPTSLHAHCPGAVVHGVIFNAIVTRNVWSFAPGWIPYVIAIAFGAVMTWAVAKLTPWGSTIVAVLLAGAYVAFNGVLLFDRWNVILGAAAPLAAIGVVWAGCTAASAGERFRINQLLHGYVDPKLVDYLNEHPENELFKTKTQEITVCFSDIQGFTTLTQQLGERMIPLLQEYLSRMVVVIRRHGGMVNKFMGDGIMFIFGVPENTNGTAHHAEQALQCCLEMQEALAKFNEERMPEGFPALKMRVGVNTGMAYVGDAGPVEAREYTALGDTTNLAARLEPANKEFQTLILVTESTYLQTLNSFVFVPVGKLQVRGRKEGTMTYELLCRADDADETCRERAEAMRAMVLSYQQGVFDGCLKMIGAIEGRFGESRVCALYRELCERYVADGTPGDFHGQVRIG